MCGSRRPLFPVAAMPLRAPLLGPLTTPVSLSTLSRLSSLSALLVSAQRCKGCLQATPGAEAELERPTPASVSMWGSAGGQDAFAEGDTYIVTCLEPYTGRSAACR